MTDRRTLLRIYLQDHAAIAGGVAARARRLAAAERDSDDGVRLARFADDVAADHDALRTIMRSLGIEPNGAKDLLANAGEKIGALKPNGYVIRRSPLSTIIELEAMQAAVRAKESLWASLAALEPDATVASKLAPLHQRAVDQLAVLDEVHATRITEVFSPNTASAPAGPA